MRRLAAELGAGTMSIYNHVTDKDDLFDAMVQRIVGEVRVTAAADWQEIVTGWVTDSRRALLDHRALVPLVVAPERSGHIGQIGVAVREALEGLGLRPSDAALVVRVAARYLAGSVLLDTPRDRRGRPPREALDATFAAGLEALLVGLTEAVGPVRA